MNIVIGAMGIVGCVIILLSLSNMLLHPLHLFMKIIKVRELRFSFYILGLGILLVLPGYFHEVSVGKIDKNFSLTANQIYKELQNPKLVAELKSTNSPGVMNLNDSSTLTLIPATPAPHALNSNAKAPSFYQVQVDLHNLDLVVTGSFKAGFQKWCFAASQGRRQEVFNQYGIATGNLASHTTLTNPGLGTCTDGVVTSLNGNVIPQ